MKTFNLSLDTNQLYKTANEIREYAREFAEKVKAFTEACADHGIMIAQMHEGDFTGYIAYSKRFEIEDNEYTVYIAASSSEILKTWYTSATGDNTKSASINPLLMAEFGSGFKALSEIPSGVTAGQGTLNTYGHANQPYGWSWWTDDASDQEGATMIKSKGGRWLFHSTGTPPSRPLHNAAQSLINDVEGIALSIFH